MKKGIIYFSLLMSIMLLFCNYNIAMAIDGFNSITRTSVEEKTDSFTVKKMQLDSEGNYTEKTDTFYKSENPYYQIQLEQANKDSKNIFDIEKWNSWMALCKQKGNCNGSSSTTTSSASEENTKTPAPGSSNKTTSNLVLNGCGEGSGLFSGLVKTGSNIFLGLRDLIYVVAGFGIIGVAVGGFFGNLNWKWLGAIIIGLIVIASTGEIIATVTDCKQFTSTVIQDTLK